MPTYTNSNQFPALAIDENNNVGIGINRTSTRDFTRKTLHNGEIINEDVIEEEIKFQVNGVSCFNEILMYDYYTNSHKALDDIYVRSSGISVINTTQISEGDFLGNLYNFNNIGVNDLLSTNKLQVNTDVNVDNNIETKTLVVNDVANFTGIVQFDNDVNFTNAESVNINKLKVADDIYIGNRKIIPIDIDDPTTGYGTYSRSEDGSNYFFVYVHSNIATLDANCNISFPRKLAVGLTETDGFDGVLNIIKDDVTTSNNFDITLKNTVEEKEYYANIGRLSRLDYYDNSLILNTNKVSGKRNNIYFYPETDISELTSNYYLPNIRNVPPTMSMNRERVGINKYAARVGYELDVEGNVAARDYYLTVGNEMHRTRSFIYQSKNFFNIYDSQTDKFCINYNNLTSYASSMKGLNVKRGINADYYYQNDKIIETLQMTNDTYGFHTNKKISLGWQGENVSVPLQIRNLTTEDNNYSVIRIYRGVRGGGARNNADYSGIDICEYDRNLGNDRNAERWFIYKNHTFNDVDSRNVQRIGPLQIGYIDKDTKPTTYGMSFFYNSTNSNYHIDVNKNTVSYDDNNSAMSIYGDLDVHGNINIIDKYGSNYNFRLSTLETLSQITQYIKTVETTESHEAALDDETGLPSGNNDIRYTGFNILYTPNKSVIVDPVDRKAIPMIVKQDNSNYAVTKFITYADNTSNCSSSLELGIYNCNLLIADDDIEKENNIKNMIKFNLSTDDSKHTNFDMSFFHDNYYKKFYNFKNNIDDSGNFLSSSTHIGVGNNIDNNSNVAFHIDDINRYGIQVTNSHYAPAINLLYTGGTCNIYHTLSGSSFENNYRFSIDVANKSTFNEPESSNVFIIDAFDGNNIRKGARFGFNDDILNESFAIKTDYDTAAMAITSRYTSEYIFDSVVDIKSNNLILETLSSNWNNTNKEYSVTYNYGITSFPNLDNNLNLISESNKNDPNFIFKSSVSLSNDVNYITFHSNLDITYNVSNLDVDFINYETGILNLTNYEDNNTICIFNFKTDLFTCNIILNPELSFGKNTITTDDSESHIISIVDSFSCNLTLIDNIASNYDFTYNYTNVILLPENLSCNITYQSEFNSNIVGDSNVMYIDNKIYTDILPFDSNNFYYEYINAENDIRPLNDNGIYTNILLQTTTSNIVRINSNIDVSGKFLAERNNTIIFKTSNILPDSFMNLDSIDNSFNYTYDIVLDGDSSNVYLNSSNFVVNNNVNSIARNMELFLINSDYLIEDNFDIYGNNFTNKIYLNEYFNKLSDIQDDNYIIRIKNYNYKNFKPHITLANDVDKINSIAGHEIYSYDGVLEIKYVDSTNNNTWIPLKIDTDGNAFLKGGLDMGGNIRFDGKIYDANGNDLIEILNKNYYKEYEINSSNIHFNSLGSNGVEIHAYSSCNYDDFKFFYAQDFLDDGITKDVMILHKRLDEETQYKIDLYGDIDTSNGILRVEGRDIIRDTCNYILDTSNVISNRITNLETDFISEEAHSSNRFIVNHKYDNNLLVNGNLTINSNLIVLGDTTTLNTDVYTTEQLDVENGGTGVALKVKQNSNYDIVNILNDNDEVFTILHNGNVGIYNENPIVALDVNRNDSIKVPRGDVSQRPVDNSETDSSHRGYIRYNTEYHEFEGYGSNNKWGVLGGVKDADRDTYIIAEDYAGNDNDELKLVTAGNERMIVKADGKIGIAITEPTYKLDIDGDIRASSNLYIYSNFGINNETPYVTMDINTTDSIKIPKGDVSQRPVDNSETDSSHRGYIRYNTEYHEFEGYGSNNKWGVLGGVKDADRDTYIIAEDYAGYDNDELKLVTAGIERMIVKADGKIGIAITEPTYKLDIDGDIRASSNLYIYSNLGINNETPYVTMDINTTDSIKIPKGDVSQRPVDNSETDSSHRGYIRFNTELEQFEGYGEGNKWGVLGGVRDTDRDTYIIAEDYAGDDNDELKLVTAGSERMIVKADGKIGIGMSDPTYYLDVVGDIRVSSNLYIYSNFGINNETPYVTMDVNTTDSIKVPRGDNSQRPVDNTNTDNSHRGYIRFNTELEQFEGYGEGNKWGVLGGVRDTDRDTYIIAEDYAGDDNDELKLVTSGNERMIVKADGKIGIGMSDPTYYLDIVGDIRVSSNLYIYSNFGINNETPYVAMDINTTDSIKIPRGTSAQRPVSGAEEGIDLSSHKGYIRFNTDLEQFEGFGAGNKWGSLGGIKDVDGDTYVTAENSAGDDNDELKFFTKDVERMVISSNGLIGIGTKHPNYVIDVVGGVNIITEGIDHIFTIDDRDIMQETSNYITNTSNVISNRITELETDFISEESHSSNRFIINHKYDNNLLVNGNLTINSNLLVRGDTTTLNTDVYTTEQLDVQNTESGVAFNLKQNDKVYNIFNVSNSIDQVFTITNDGSVGIGVTNPNNNGNLLDVKGNVNIVSGDDDYIFTIDGRDIMQETCNYVTDTSNVISNRISDLETDFISEEAHSSNRFIVNHKYDNDLLVNGTLTINSNLIVLGDESRLNTEVYSSEQIEITNNDTDVALKITQKGNQDIVNIFNDEAEIFTILQSGNVGINIDNPLVALEINRTDSIKIPVGTSVQRPTEGLAEGIDLSYHRGYIRYNTDLDQFEGFGAGNTWGSLGGIKDVDGDTYIAAENSAGDDNDELKFFTSNFERMVITSNGLIGVGTTNPDYKIDVVGTGKISESLYIGDKFGINTETPNVSIHVNTTDSIKIPVGTNAQRPTEGLAEGIDLSSHRGYIRYNTDLDQFEGFGAGNTWGSLGGIKDVDGDTYIAAENSAGNDNDELKFFTSNFERMVITSNGLVGIGTTSPDKNLTIYNENSSLSIQDPRNNIDAVSSIELVNGSNNDFDKNEDTYGWKISNSNELFNIASGNNNIINDRFTIDGKTGNIGIGTKPHIYIPGTDEDEFKLNIEGSLNFSGDIYRDGTLFFGSGGGGGSTGVMSQNMTVQTLTKTYNETRVMSENNAQNENVVVDNCWRFIDNDLNSGFIIKIKPSHPRSKILLNLSCHIGFDSALDSRWWGIKLYRKIEGEEDGWQEVEEANGNPDDVGGSTACWLSHNLGANLSSYENFVANVSGSFCDTPNTRKEVYYTIKWKSRLGDTSTTSDNGNLYLNRPAKYNAAFTPVLSSSWVAQEIWQLGTPYVPANGSNIITLYNQDYVGIGNTEPVYELDLIGNFRSDGNIFVDGKIGINTYSPAFTIDMNTEDGIKIPSGETSKRPDNTTVTKGVIRYNTETDQFEGYGAGNSWGSLGGVIDVDQDTYVKAESSANADNDELQFVTDGTEKMIIKQDGKIGINTSLPAFSLDLNTTDGIKIPAGGEDTKPTNLVTSNYGLIRYNTDRSQFEGYGAGDAWGSLGGVKDIDGDTYISAENNPGDNNDELKFYTSNFERMVLTSNGNLGVGNTDPSYKIDVNGEVNASAFNINGAPFRLEFPKGMMLQTKHMTYTDTCTKSDTETDWVPVDNNLTTGFVIRVKPTHTTSKILLNLICHIGMDYLQDSRWWGLKLYRKIGTGNWIEVSGANGTGVNNGSACWISHNLGAESSIYSHSITNVTGSYEDAPNTTDDVYYTIYWKSRLDGTSGRLYLNKSAESYSDNYPKPSSSWSASEIWNNGVSYIPPVSSSVISLSGEKVGIGVVPTIDSTYKLNVDGNIKCHNLFQTSDKRYKKNIEQLDSALHLIDGIDPVSYNTENDSKTKYGFIAQDLEGIIPNIVNIPSDTNDLYSIDYISMIPLLTKSIQELSNIINNQQKEINELKSKL